MTGRIFDIQHFCTHDGPGIRTVVFLQGCSLRCRWCHNPESQQTRPHLRFLEQRCISCGMCREVCPHQVHQSIDGRHAVAFEQCHACRQCVDACPAEALGLVGREATVEEILQQVLRDRPFYHNSGGGMTLSGGEPLFQPAFSLALLRLAKSAGLHTAVETSGQGAWAELTKIAAVTDLFLYDIKELDDSRHRQFTSGSNRAILENLRRLDNHGAELVLRLPIIPGYNDRTDHFQAVAALVHELKHVRKVELLPYHSLGAAKQASMGLGDSMAHLPVPSAELKAQWTQWLDDAMSGQDRR